MLFSRCVFCEKNGQITSDAFVMFPNMHKHTHMSEQNKQIYIGTNHTNIYRNKTNKYISEQITQIYIKTNKYISEQNIEIYIATIQTNIYCSKTNKYISEQNKQIYFGTKQTNIYRNKTNKYISEQNKQIYI